MSSKTISIFLILLLISCSSTKSVEKPIYTITDGLTLRFEIRNKNSGKLLINGNQDSIPFNYIVIKTKKNVLENKTSKYKKIILYEYKIDYLENSKINYPILENFSTLPALKKTKLFIYKSHT